MTPSQTIAAKAWDACKDWQSMVRNYRSGEYPNREEYLASLTPAEKIDLPPYILERENGISWYKYLHITGGSGNFNSKREDNLYGGEYDYLIFYAAASDMVGKTDECYRFFCKRNNILYGIGNTINEAYENLKSKL